MGVLEPLVVARSPEQPRRYLLLDVHLRHAVPTDAGETMAQSLIAHDDEAFTYNNGRQLLAAIAAFGFPTAPLTAADGSHRRPLRRVLMGVLKHQADCTLT